MTGRILRIASMGNLDATRQDWMSHPLIDLRAFWGSSDGLAVVAAEHYDAVVVHGGGSRTLGLAMVTAVRRAAPSSAVILMAPDPTSALTTDALRAGAQECLPVGTPADAFFAIAQRCVVRHGERRRLELDARTDPLTGLPNRHALNLALVDALKLAPSSELGLAIALVDVDHFKRINDTFGHAGGDRVLRHVATTLRASVRHTDLIARLGGDEFVCLCAHLPLSAPLSDMAKAVRTSVASALSLTSLRGARETVHVSVSIGVASYPLAGTTAAQLLAAADRAMYAAKTSGDGVRVAGTPIDLTARRRTRELEIPAHFNKQSVAEVG